MLTTKVGTSSRCWRIGGQGAHESGFARAPDAVETDDEGPLQAR